MNVLEIGKTAERNQGNKLMNIRVVNNNKEKYIITNKLNRILAPLLSELKSRFFFRETCVNKMKCYYNGFFYVAHDTLKPYALCRFVNHYLLHFCIMKCKKIKSNI